MNSLERLGRKLGLAHRVRLPLSRLPLLLRPVRLQVRPLARLRLRSLVDAVTDPPCEVVAEAAAWAVEQLTA